MTEILQAAKTETYNDIYLLLCNIVHKFRKKYGGDFYELQSEADYLFLVAYDSYENDKSAFSSWIYLKVWNGLIDFMRTTHRKNSRMLYLDNLELLDHQKHIQASAVHFLFHLKEDLSMESQDIISILLDMPVELFELVNKTKQSPTNIRVCLKKHLKNSGWTLKQISECFSEIKKVMGHV